MWKLIKMDFYRLFNSKAIKIGAIMSVLLSAGYILLSFGIIALSKIAFNDDPMMAENLGIFLSQAAWMNGVDLSEIVFSGTTAFSLFIGCMISASFMGSELSCGYTKNYAGQLKNKGYMAVSKFVTTSFVQTMVLVIYIVVCAIFGSLVLRQYISGFDAKTLFWALGLRLMLHLAINAIIVFICTFTNSNSIAIVVGCILGLGVTRVAYTMLALILGTAKINIDLANYMPDGINGQLTLYTVGELSQRTIVVSIVFIVAFLMASCYVVRNRDVK